MRQNPPFNMDYITATFLLERLSKKTQIINNPFAVRNMPEKLYSIDFLKLMPPTIFTKNINEIENILNQVLQDNEAMVEEYKSGKDKAFNALIGQVMKASKGKANPGQVSQLLKEKLAD